MIAPKTKAEIKRLTDNHTNNKNLPIITNSVFVTRQHFEQFLDNLPVDHDAFKICFIRHEFIPPDPSKILPVPGSNLTQLSLIFVPMRDTDRVTWASTEATDPNDNDRISTLSFCVPGIPDRDSTGHCPPASGCPPPDGSSGNP